MRELSWLVLGMFFGLNVQYWIKRSYDELHNHFHDTAELDENYWDKDNEVEHPESPEAVRKGYDQEPK